MADKLARISKGLPTKFPIAGVKRVILVASGKGGVGKSTLAVNLALAMAHRMGRQFSIGLMDADIFGPSIPKMMNLSGAPDSNKQGLIVPMINYGVKCMSMGFLTNEQSPTIWRGLMVMQAVQTLIRKVAWGPLDYLLVDMPPGTGDVQLSMTQNIPIDGALIVSTPQDIALLDARKGAEMFRKVNVRVLGLVENMSEYSCGQCGHVTRMYGDDDRLRTMAKELKTDVLASIPFHPSIVRGSDQGQPIVLAEPDSPVTEAFVKLANGVLNGLPKSDHPTENAMEEESNEKPKWKKKK